jgi:hypothetical protein
VVPEKCPKMPAAEMVPKYGVFGEFLRFKKSHVIGPKICIYHSIELALRNVFKKEIAKKDQFCEEISSFF